MTHTDVIILLIEVGVLAVAALVGMLQVTHEEACTQLRALGADLKYGRLTLADWADEVERVLALAYPDAIDPRLVRAMFRPRPAPPPAVTRRPVARPPGASALRAAGLAPATVQAGQ